VESEILSSFDCAAQSLRSAQDDGHALFHFHFSVPLPSLRSVPGTRTNIVLIGFMGSGKSSIGRLVGARLGFQFVDTDAVLVERDGREIAEIFAQDGEARFRDLETAVLESLGARNRCVISTGGGVILREKNRAFTPPTRARPSRSSSPPANLATKRLRSSSSIPLRSPTPPPRTP